jgi:ATP-dependent DNA helicase RecQ
LKKINAFNIEGGFLVLYSPMKIVRIEDTGKRYLKGDYNKLETFYKNKSQQIHIVGEYAKKMLRDYNKALEFVNDYFIME